MSVADLARSGGRLVRFVVQQTFVEPVREGHLRRHGWPAGLGPIVTAGLVIYVVTMAAAVFSRLLRRHTPLLFAPPDQTLPVPAVALVGLTMIVALTCLFTAGLHLRVPLRVAITVLVVAILVHPVDWSHLEPVDVVMVALAAALPVLAVLRWRRSFRPWEFVVSLVVIGHAVVVHFVVSLGPLTAIQPGLPLSQLVLLTQPAWSLAAPLAVLAGVTLVEITATATTWTVSGLWDRLGRRGSARRWAGWLLGVLVAVRVVQEVVRLRSQSEPVGLGQLLLGAAVAAVVFGAGLLAMWLADRTPTGDRAERPDGEQLLHPWSHWSPRLAVFLAAGVCLPVLLAYVLRSFGLTRAAQAVNDVGGSYYTQLSAATIAVGAIVAAIVVGCRGRRRSGLLLMMFGTMFAAGTALDTGRLLATTADILLTITVATVVTLVVLAVTGRLTPQSEVALAGVLLLTIAYPYRDWFNEPLTRLVSLGGVSAALLVGLVWRILTDNAFTRGDSPDFPQPSRVLLALANALVGVTFAAQVALLGGRSDLDLDQAESIGDSTLGFPLVLALLFSGLLLAARGRVVGRSLARAAD